jgi:hypothetical protein
VGAGAKPKKVRKKAKVLSPKEKKRKFALFLSLRGESKGLE